MSDDNFTRRNFLAGMATTGTASMLPTATTVHPTAHESKPAAGTIKIVCAEKLTNEEIAKIRASAPNIELKMVLSRAELRNHVADAEVILGVVDKETMMEAKQLKWVQTWAAGVELLPKESWSHETPDKFATRLSRCSRRMSRKKPTSTPLPIPISSASPNAISTAGNSCASSPAG